MHPRSSARPSRLAVILAFAGATAVAVALIVVAVLFRSGSDAPPPFATPAVELTGIPQDDRLLGNPNARVSLIEYADPQCPGCRFYTEEVFPSVVTEYVEPGKVKTEFRGFPFIGPDSVTALRFIYAAGLQDKLWQLQEALYRNQGAANSGWVTDDSVREVASTVAGLDVDKLFLDAATGAIASEVESAKAEAEAAGIPGTPTFLIRIGQSKPYVIQVGSVEQMQNALDDALAG